MTTCQSLHISGACLVTHESSPDVPNMEQLPPEVQEHFRDLHTTTSISNKNVLCGIHISSCARLLSCSEGQAHGYVVDLRQDSATYLHWCGVLLGAGLPRSLLIPASCGLAYYTTEDSTTITVTWGSTSGAIESRVAPQDPLVNIDYPIAEGVTPTMDQMDKDAAAVQTAAEGINFEQKRKRVLIIGMSGQVGGALARVFEQHKNRYSIIGTHNTHPVPGSMPFDLERAADDMEYCTFVLHCCRPHIVIMCSAFTWVDGCQNNPEKAKKLNATSVENVARVAHSLDAQFAFYSTDYVFDGTQTRDPKDPDTWVLETDDINPLNKYGQSKADAEKVALQVNPKSLVLRTTRIYGPEMQGKNFIYQVATKLSQGNKIPCLKNEVGCPTYNKDLAELTRLLLEKGCSGIYHCSGPEAMGKAEWGHTVARYFGLNVDLIQEVDHADAPGAPRPTMVPMSQMKLKNALPEFKFHSLSEGLKSWRESGVGKPVPWPQ